MATEIDSLEIKIEATAESANKSIDKLASSIEKIGKNIGIIGKEKGLENVDKNAIIMSKSMENVAKQVTDSLQQITEKYKELGKGFTFSGSFDSINKQIDKYSNALENAKVKKQELELSGRTEGSMYEYAVRDVLKYENIIESLKNQLKEIQNWNPNINININGISEAKENIRGVAEQIRTVSLPASSFNYNAGAMAAVFGDAASEIQNYSQAVEQFGERAGMVLNQNPQIKLNGAEEAKGELSSLSDSFSNVGYSARNASDIIKNAFNGLLGIFKRIGSSISSLAINIKKGLVGAFSKLTSVTKGSENYFKKNLTAILKYGFGISSLYTLFNKLRNAIKEGMNNLVQYSSETNESVSLLSNSVNQLKNALSSMAAPLLNLLAPALNQIIQMCIKVANAVNQIISALTGKNTWIKAIGLTNDYASSLDNVGNSAKKAKDKIQKGTRAFDELKTISTNNNEDGAGSGGGAGTKDMYETVPIDASIADFAQKIKDAWANADFTEIGSILGRKLKNALDGIDWEPVKETASKIGKSLGTLINGFVEVEGLGYSIGKTIAEAINTGVSLVNSLLDNTHWDSVGKFVGDSLNGIVKTVDWNGIGHLFAQSLNAMFETIGNAAYTFDWKNLGKSLSDSINTFVKDFKWAENSKKLSELAKGFLDTIITFLEETDWKQLGNKVAEFIKNVDWSGIAERISEGIGAAIGGLASFLWGLIEESWNDVVDWWKEAAYEDGEFTIEGLLYGISEKLVDIGSWIKERIFKPFVNGIKKAFGIASPAKEMKPLGKNIILGVVEGFGQAYSDLKNKILEIKNIISEKFTEIREKISELVEKTKTTVTGKFEEIRKNISEKVSSAYSTARTYFSYILSTISTNVTEALKKVRENFEAIKTKISETLTTAQNKVKETLTNIYTKIKENSENAYEKVKSYFEKIKSKINEVMTGVKNSIEKFTTAVNDAIKKIKEFFTQSDKTFKITLPTDTFTKFFNSVKNVIDKLKELFGYNGQTVTVNTNTNSSSATAQKDGGVFVNGSWKPIQQFAFGGMPNQGQLFYAREAGPELVGTIGGNTAVMNNNQIVESVSAGVYSAVVAALSQSKGLSNVTIQVEGDPNGIFRVVRKKANEYQRMTGNPAFI